MIDLERLRKMGGACGFDHVEPLDASTIELMQDVRAMCEANTCRMYGKNWRCPPAVGTLAECEADIRRYRRGIIVQTVGELEDELDGETMMETEAAHKEHFDAMHLRLLEEYPNLLALGAGTCTRCRKCTYPDAPCRFPEHNFASMEAYGMLVTQVCRANHLEYYYGPCTIAYTSCFLLE